MNELILLPCLDSDERAARCREVLDIPRARAAELGRTAVQAAETGVYTDAEGRSVQWQAAVAQAVAAKRSLPPDAVLPVSAVTRSAQTSVQVANETTLAAARRLADTGEPVLALNFANGIQPGGGFLSGARAQEEVLCRSSALYATLRGDPMYAAHAARALPDSTDWAILSPEVPVFRADDGTALPAPWALSVLTCAAPYAPGIGQPRAGDLLAVRIRRVLAIARAYDYSALVLGAWGCGAFGNDPRPYRARLPCRTCRGAQRHLCTGRLRHRRLVAGAALSGAIPGPTHRRRILAGSVRPQCDVLANHIAQHPSASPMPWPRTSSQATIKRA